MAPSAVERYRRGSAGPDAPAEAPAGPRGVSPPRSASRTEPDTILRFTRSERLVHWSIAVPFLVCWATAAVLFAVYHSDPGRPYRDVVSWIHRLSGLCLFLGPTLVILRSGRDFRVHVDNVRQAWVWTLADFKWLCLMGLAAVSDRFTLPEQGKFNAAEKLNFMMVMGTWPLYIVTGIAIWLPGVAFVAWAVHVAMAVAAAPLIAGHIFMATINPDTRAGLSGMVSGFVNRQWAKHHYRRWYREQFESPAGSEPRIRPVSACRSHPVVVPCPSCDGDHTLASLDSLLQKLWTGEPVRCRHCDVAIDRLSVTSEPQDLEWILDQLDAAARHALERGGEVVLLDPSFHDTTAGPQQP